MNFFPRITAAALALLLVPPTFSAQKEPSAQRESDWVDARWNATDIGSFHSSLVSTPAGIVAKGLSIRLGEHTNASVVYDTATASLRAIWTGGFVEFEASRYGLLRTPHPAGDVQFVAPKGPSWREPVRWRGLHVNGSRVVLDYEVGGARVLETPWAETARDVTAVTRTFALTKGTTAILALAEGKEPTLSTRAGVNLATIVTKQGWESFAAESGAAKFIVESNSIKLQIKADADVKLMRSSPRW
jgi:hypothetical protein